MFERPGRPSDRFKPPFANEQAARAANNGALPPDLSLIAKAREGGPDYVYRHADRLRAMPPADIKMAEGMNYNEYFPGHQIAMPPPLTDDAVTYRRRHQGDASTRWRRTWRPSSPGRPSRSWRSASAPASRSILFLVVLTGLLYAAQAQGLGRTVH